MRRLHTILAVLAVGLAQAAPAVPQVGLASNRDAFGYSAKTSLGVGGPTYAPLDISNTGQEALTRGSLVSPPITLATPWRLYDKSFDQVVMSAHMYVTTNLADDGNEFSLWQVPPNPDLALRQRLLVRVDAFNVVETAGVCQ